jgi:ribosomal protein S12 methylthiotransferase
VIPLMAEGKLLPYLDIPFQHAHPEVLRAMKRPAASEKTLDRINAWRRICPDITLRSTFIVGFPGETEAQFQHLLDFLEEAQLDRVGCFTYSPVEGASANAIEPAVPEEVKQERLARFMEKQAAISARKLQRKIGRELEVLIDEVGADGSIGRTQADAPEIDGLVYLLDDLAVKPGERVRVRITAADEHDLWGERCLR